MKGKDATRKNWMPDAFSCTVKEIQKTSIIAVFSELLGIILMLLMIKWEIV